MNPAEVRQVSPFRYPGGKTWLVPSVLAWLASRRERPRLFIEPFAGGASVGLAVAESGLADRVLLTELDARVAAVWHVLVNGTDRDFEQLCEQVGRFVVTAHSVGELLAREPESVVDIAFATIVANRVKRGGILAERASLMKEGERGKGLASRWYPDTLVKRFAAVRALRERLRFEERDAFGVLDEHAHRTDAAWFVDPPYTAGGRMAGMRLYSCHQVDHERLFKWMATCRGPVMATYDDAPEVRCLVARNGFTAQGVRSPSNQRQMSDELVVLNGAAHVK